MSATGSKSMDWITAERIAYESTQEWKAYRDAAEDWEANWQEFIACSTEENRNSLIASMNRKDELLAIVRRTPEHFACFGY